MKRDVSIVLLLIFFLRAYSQNLVVNPGFESWDKISKPSGWATCQSCQKDSAFINSDNYSCRHEGGTSSKYLGQTISVTPLVHYTLSFFYRNEITENGNGCRIWCYWKDIDGVNISDPATDPILRPSKYLKKDVWDQFSADMTAPSGAVSFYLEVRTYPNSITYWDDFVFEETTVSKNTESLAAKLLIYPNPVSNNLIINGIQNVQQIDIFEFTGTLIWSSDFDGEEIITIPVNQLQDGIYIISIHTSDMILCRKFIKKEK